MSAKRTSTSSRNETLEADKTENLPSRPMVQFWLGPHNEGALEQPDSVGRVTGPCGDTMEISLKIDKNKIIDSRFQVQGCLVSRACASIAAAMAKGKELEEAWDIDEGQISGKLKDIPADHLHCPVLARDTLRLAIEIYLKQIKGKEPGAESIEHRVKKEALET